MYMHQMGGGPPLPAPPAAEEGEGVDSPGEGPGEVAGAPVDPNEAAGAMGGEQPVAEQNAATAAGE